MDKWQSQQYQQPPTVAKVELQSQTRANHEMNHHKSPKMTCCPVLHYCSLQAAVSCTLQTDASAINRSRSNDSFSRYHHNWLILYATTAAQAINFCQVYCFTNPMCTTYYLAQGSCLPNYSSIQLMQCFT